MSKLIIVVFALLGATIAFASIGWFSKSVDILGTNVTYGFLGLCGIILAATKVKNAN